MPWPFSKFAIPLVKATHIFGGGGKEKDLLIMLLHPLLSFKNMTSGITGKLNSKRCLKRNNINRGGKHEIKILNVPLGKTDFVEMWKKIQRRKF